MQASLEFSAYGMLSSCVHHRRLATSVPDLLPPSTGSSRPGSQAQHWPVPPLFHHYMPTHSSTTNKNREWGILTFSWPSARPSRPLVCRPWLRFQSPSCRIVLRRLVPLRLSCSFFSSNKPPQRLSRALPMGNTRAQFLSRRCFDLDNQSRLGDDVGGWILSQEPG